MTIIALDIYFLRLTKKIISQKKLTKIKSISYQNILKILLESLILILDQKIMIGSWEIKC